MIQQLSSDRALRVFFASALALVLCLPGYAQEEEPALQTSLCVVNAVPGDKNVFVSFDGQSIWSPGFTPGQSTAAVMFPSGKPMVKIECEGYAPAEARLDLPPGANCAIIIYPGEVVAEGPDKGKRRIGVFVPPPHLAGARASEGKRWKAVLVGSPAPAELEINGKKAVLSPRKATDIPAPDGFLSVKHQGRDVLGAAPEDAGEFWAVIFPVGNELQGVVLNHSPFKVPSG